MTPERQTYRPVIGLEVHLQLATASKLFCGCRAAYGEAPNSLTCPVCLGHPGALPVLNRTAVTYALRLILAVEGEIQAQSEFARKNYFYPDLPKGYQISQYDLPLGKGGALAVTLPDGAVSDVRLIRLHLEEDAGKSLHPENGGDRTRLDLNRCGVPLVEVVTEPDMTTAAEAMAFLRTLRRLVQYLGVCSGDMEKGALRCDANVSVGRLEDGRPGVRTEIKNLNSVRAVGRAIDFEIARHRRLIEAGETVAAETRLWNEKAQATEPMRGKESSGDYRYFPEPDLPRLVVDDAWIETVRRSMPELPDARRNRFVSAYGLTAADAAILTDTPDLGAYFDSLAAAVADPASAAAWVLTEVLGMLHDRRVDIASFAVSPAALAGLLREKDSGVISGKMAKEIFAEMVDTGRSASDIIAGQGLKQISDPGRIRDVVAETLAGHPDNVAAYRAGRRQLFDFFVGQVMKNTRGRANPQLVNRIVKELLDG